MTQKLEFPVPGRPRPYIRDGVPGLSLERQEEILATWFDFSDDATFWVDRLSQSKIKARVPLPMRDEVVDPQGHRPLGETIYVAGLRVLGWDHLDMMRAVKKAFAKQCRIYCADTGEVYSPESSATEMLKVLTLSEEARRQARSSRAVDGRLTQRERRRKNGLAIARPLWWTEMTVAEIAEKSGMSASTLYKHLPPRNIEYGKRHS